MIWFAIVGVALLCGLWRFAPVSDDLYVSEETRMYYAAERQARQRAFVDWSSIEHLDAWPDSERKVD